MQSVYTIKEVMKLSNLGRSTVYNYFKNNNKMRKVGNSFLLDANFADELICKMDNMITISEASRQTGRTVTAISCMTKDGFIRSMRLNVGQSRIYVHKDDLNKIRVGRRSLSRGPRKKPSFVSTRESDVLDRIEKVASRLEEVCAMVLNEI